MAKFPIVDATSTEPSEAGKLARQLVDAHLAETDSTDDADERMISAVTLAILDLAAAIRNS